MGEGTHLYTTNVGQSTDNVSILREDVVDIGAQQATQDGVDDNIGRRQESHDTTQRGHLGILALHPSEGGLDKGCERDVSSCPTH